jgi:drug/metabolite transporter (DMT)-like permease
MTGKQPDGAGLTNSAGLGIFYMLLGSALLTSSDAVVKWLATDYPIGQIMVLRGLFICIPVAFIVWRGGGIGLLRVTNMGGQAARALCFIASVWFFLTGLKFNPLADNIAIAFAGPLFVTAMATPLLGEFVGWRRWMAVIVGFAGILVMLRPSGAGLNGYLLLPLGAAVFGGLRDVLTRRISATESSVSILFVSTIAVIIAGLFTAGFGDWRWLTAMDVGLMALTGLLSGAAHYLLIQAFATSEASLVAPFKYSSLLWGVLIGVIVWGDLPDKWMIVGSVLVVGSGLYILHREMLRKRAV